MLSKARGCNALATSLEMQQIRDAPLVMHQDHSESLGLHVAQRINCYKLPRKLPQIRSAQQIPNGWQQVSAKGGGWQRCREEPGL